MEVSDLTPEEREQLRREDRMAVLRGARLAHLAKKFYWDENVGRYRDSGGRFVSERVVRAAIDDALKKSALEIRALAQQLREGSISLADWQERMIREIKNVHTTNAALARGGFRQLTGADFERVARIVGSEMEFLRGFAQAVEDGTQRLDGTVLARAQQYTQAGRMTHHRFERLEKQKRGYNLERNVLGVAEHCDECEFLSGEGWVPNGTLPLIGQRTCMRNCHCHIEYMSTEETATLYDEFPVPPLNEQ